MGIFYLSQCSSHRKPTSTLKHLCITTTPANMFLPDKYLIWKEVKFCRNCQDLCEADTSEKCEDTGQLIKIKSFNKRKTQAQKTRQGKELGQGTLQLNTDK